LFENARDIRYFLSLVARAVRTGSIELLAYVIMPTHFHLLVRSNDGRLSATMQTIEKTYVYYFNRTHERDGHLVQGRFRSKPVVSDGHLSLLPAYFDFNPVTARIVDDPSRYPHGSAFHYARPKGPRWLSRDWVEGVVKQMSGHRNYVPEAYAQTLGARPTRGQHRVVMERLRCQPGTDDLDDLVGASPPRIRAWLERVGRAADGFGLGPPVVDEETIATVVADIPKEATVAPFGRRRVARDVVHMVLLRILARLRIAAIARRLAVAPATVTAAFAAHRRLVEGNQDYSAWITRATMAAITLCHRPGVGDRPAKESTRSETAA
jgi:REP element-mobilizing transposase RayT